MVKRLRVLTDHFWLPGFFPCWFSFFFFFFLSFFFFFFFWKGRALFGLCIWVTVHWGKTRQYLMVGTWKQELNQRPGRNAASWLAPHRLLFYISQDPQARGSTTYSGLGPLTLVINQENVLQNCLQAIWWRHFINPPINSNLCQAHTQACTRVHTQSKQRNKEKIPNNN